MDFDTTLSRTQIDRLVAAVAPEWEVREATPAESGHHVVYLLAVDTPDGDRECCLKATPPGHGNPSVDLEARLLAILDRHTDVPVPGVLGAVDEHDTLPAPFLLMDAASGETISRQEYASLPDDSLRRIATQTGRHLASLHALDAVDAFGSLTRDGPTLHGERPSGGVDTIRVVNPIADWRAQLREWADETLAEMEATRFADVVPDARAVLDTEIDRVEAPGEPVVARVGQPFENVLLNEGDIEVQLDWESTIAATPAYDVVAAVQSIAWRPHLLAPGVPDRRDLVRDALLDGYRERGDSRAADRVRVNGTCYELLWTLRWMAHLEEWCQAADPDRRLDAVAEDLREEVSTTL